VDPRAGLNVGAERPLVILDCLLEINGSNVGRVPGYSDSFFVVFLTFFFRGMIG